VEENQKHKIKMQNNFIYKSTGQYLGFVQNNSLYSRDGAYLGWVEGNFVWDFNGKFRGVINDVGGHKYIWLNIFALLPVPRPPKLSLPPVTPAYPVETIIPSITLPVGIVDGFNL
jgi:hypothetical protein